MKNQRKKMYNWLQKISMPLSSDYVGDLFRIKSFAPKNTKISVYHGTTSKKLANILQHGSLDPTVSNLPEHKSYKDASPGIYITTSLGLGGAELYAHHAAFGLGNSEDKGDGSDPLVLELIVPVAWIEPDPDDSRLTHEGKPNEASRSQGRILRPISIKNIRQVMISNSILSKIIPNERDDFFSQFNTAWFPIGKMLDAIKKAIRSGVELPEEYYQMVNQRPKGLSRNETFQDMEQDMAEKLVTVHDTFLDSSYDVSESTFDRALEWVYKNGIYGNATAGIQSFLNSFSPNAWNDAIKGWGRSDNYMPRQNESLFSYLRRFSG